MKERRTFKAFGYVCGVAVTMLSLAGGVLAHHGVTGQYDAATPIVLSGIVTDATFSPPHPVITVQVDAPELPPFEVGRPAEYFGPSVVRTEDVGEVRKIELSPVRMFYDLADRLSVGDRVVVVALRNCLPPHQLRSSWVRLEDGAVVSYTGDWAPGIDGCS
ncbi:MAG: hypothetical protein V7704_00105 [Aurantimonas endophytica]|uniref:Uncharacterized protein n=1 Tax=Aurantimonas endophytica TaxID=1522175 RepID=A0A7W6HEG4_9HYPH|nr:hypothetical protein [Aurantimonas endophytica]MBB4003656.1 hypothetical protein [Aurantimonas endophytica]MCO6404513.1 hypothetical protein [Aurantimonas endophytica]